MNEDLLKGALNEAGGSVENLAGRASGDAGLELRGATRQGAGKAQRRAGKAKDALAGAADKVTAGVAKASDRATAAVAKISDRASEAYDRAAAGAKQVGATVEPFVQERPYAALSLAAGLGLIVGLLLAGRGPKVVYIRPPQ